MANICKRCGGYFEDPNGVIIVNPRDIIGAERYDQAHAIDYDDGDPSTTSDTFLTEEEKAIYSIRNPADRTYCHPCFFDSKDKGFYPWEIGVVSASLLASGAAADAG